jgi:hypothetical protein
LVLPLMATILRVSVSRTIVGLMPFGDGSLVKILEWSGLHARSGSRSFKEGFQMVVILGPELALAAKTMRGLNHVQAANGHLRFAPALVWEEDHGHSKKVIDELGTVHSCEVSWHFSMFGIRTRRAVIMECC